MKIIQSSPMGSEVDFSEISTVAQRRLVPVGTILPWLKNYTNTPTLPEGWVECDGSLISDTESPYNGQNAPDLTSSFLKGGATSGTTGGSATHNHQWKEGSSGNGGATWVDSDEGTYNSSGSYTSASWSNLDAYTKNATSEPAHYTVVFILKIK